MNEDDFDLYYNDGWWHRMNARIFIINLFALALLVWCIAGCEPVAHARPVPCSEQIGVLRWHDVPSVFLIRQNGAAIGYATNRFYFLIRCERGDKFTVTNLKTKLTSKPLEI